MVMKMIVPMRSGKEDCSVFSNSRELVMSSEIYWTKTRQKIISKYIFSEVRLIYVECGALMRRKAKTR